MKRPILYCAICFSAGITLSHFFRIPVVHSALISLILIALSALLFKKNILSHIFLYAALILFGAAYFQDHNILSKDHISNFISGEPRTVTIKGVVADDPVARKAFFGKENIGFTLKSESLTEGDYVYHVTGPVKVNIYAGEGENRIRFGDRIVAQGSLSKPQGLKNPGLFDYLEYLKIKNIYAVFTVNGMGSIELIKSGVAWPLQLASHKVRNGIEEAIRRYVDRRYSGFLNAILVGERSELDSAVTDDFIKTGTVHVIAISGLHVTLIAGIFLLILKFFGVKKKANLIITSAALIFYCFVAGANPPVVRATIMFVIASLGFCLDRESDILNSLAVAAFLILLWNPNELFDPSFQLSFASISGIVLFMPKIEGLFPGKPNYLVKGIAISLAAIVSVAPIVGKYFNIISPVAVIANLVIVPALFVITVISLIFLTLNFLGLNIISAYAASALSLSAQFTFYINRLFGAIPLSYIRIPAPSLVFLSLYYIFVFCFFFSKHKKELSIALLLLLNFTIWKNCFAGPDDKLKITFLDVGKGDSILLEFPYGGSMLIDTGSGGVEGFTDMGRSVVAPYIWNEGIGRLDAIVSTHFHQDHAGGALYILKNFDVGCAMDSGVAKDSSERLYDDYRKIISQRSIRRLAVYGLDEIAGFKGVRLFVINPPEDRAAFNSNEGSTVIKLEYGDFSALFCADASGKGIENMLKYQDLLRSDVLKIPHHGGSTGKEAAMKVFFEEVSPKVSIISSSAGFHSKDLLQADIYSRSAVYNTKENGAIEVITDGRSFMVKPFLRKN